MINARINRKDSGHKDGKFWGNLDVAIRTPDGGRVSYDFFTRDEALFNKIENAKTDDEILIEIGLNNFKKPILLDATKKEPTEDFRLDFED